MACPLFSVVIPALNEAERIGLCLAALRRSDLPDSELEIIVVDNGSTDRTAQIARDLGAAVIVRPSRRHGFVGALRNIGACVAKGRILAFVDADMVVAPGCLESVKEAFEGGFRGVLGFPKAAPEGASWVGRIWESRNRCEVGRRVPTVNLTSSNMFISRDVFDQVGGFDERLLSSEDKDLAFRVKRAGYESIRMPGPVLTHLGYDRGLRELVRKEMWRQGTTVILALKHGLPFRLLRNPLLSSYHLGCLLLLLLATVTGRIETALVTAALWFLPSLVMVALRSCRGFVWHERVALFVLLWVRWNASGLVLCKQVLLLIFAKNARRATVPWRVPRSSRERTESGSSTRGADSPDLGTRQGGAETGAPFFSVVIPARNEAGRIGSCLEALLANRDTGVSFETTVVDNASTDRTAEIARALGVAVVANSNHGRGCISRSRNMGAAAARGEVLVFLDADVVVPPNWLAVAKGYFDAGFEGVLHFPLSAPSHAGWVGRVWGDRNLPQSDEPIHTINMGSADMLVNRRVFNLVGGFDETFGAAEDKDLAYRIGQSGFSTVVAPGPTLIHLGYERSLGEFLRKEMWRQSHTLRVALKHGMTFRMVRGALFGFLHFVCALLCLASVAFFGGVYGIASLTAWILPSFLLAMRRRRGPLRHTDRLLLFFLQWLRWNIAGMVLVVQVLSLAVPRKKKQG